MAKDQTPVMKATPPPLGRGGYVVRFAVCDKDLQAAQRLRFACFKDHEGHEDQRGGLDQDPFDALCDHVLVEDQSGVLVCCYRVLSLASGADIHLSYSAQHYDLQRLSLFESAMVEVGRFCVHPDVRDTDVLRIAWGMLARLVDLRAAGLLFGCASFEGTDSRDYGAAFDLLAARHLAPARWLPRVKAREVVRFSDTASAVTDRRVALGQVPSLLKTYLSMGGWVSDHAVIDRDMNTLHVFTGVEIAAIPAARAKALRSV